MYSFHKKDLRKKSEGLFCRQQFVSQHQVRQGRKNYTKYIDESCNSVKQAKP